MYDTMLFTKHDATVDEKGRIFLPVKKTGLVENENVYLFYSEHRDCIIIRSEESIKKIGSKYIDADPKEREEKLEELGTFFFNSIGNVKATKDGRITLGIEACANVNLVGTAFIVGCFDEIRVYPSEEVYLESIQSKKDIKIKQLGSK